MFVECGVAAVVVVVVIDVSIFVGVITVVDYGDCWLYHCCCYCCCVRY